MGIFFVDCEGEPPDGSAEPRRVEQLLVDTGSEYTWLPTEDLERASIAVRKKDLEFVMANGQVITRPVGYAILRCQGFETALWSMPGVRCWSRPAPIRWQELYDPRQQPPAAEALVHS